MEKITSLIRSQFKDQIDNGHRINFELEISNGTLKLVCYVKK